MAIKLLVRIVDEDRTPTEHAFDDQAVITIGRDSAADLTLFDDEMMVSRLHARLEMLDGTYHLSDLGSRNFSSIKGERLTPGQVYPINDGDTFHIANYEVQFKHDKAPAVDFGETRFDVGFVNPFFAHVTPFVHAMEAMQIEFDKLPAVRKEAAMAEAFAEVMANVKGNPVFQYISSGANASGAPNMPSSVPPQDVVTPPAPTPPSPAALPLPTPPSQVAPPLPEAPPPPPSQPQAPPVPLDIPLHEGSSRFLKFFANDQSRLDKFLDVLMDYVSKQVKVPWQFKYEFIGHTFIPTEDSKAVYESDAMGLASFLFDETCDDAELDRRFELVREALNEGLVHQMAILDGYRAAVNAGTKLMIDELDPKKIQEELESDNAIKKHLAFLSQAQGFAIMVEKHAELASEDISVLERRTYRPAFIKSYLERTTSG